MSTPPTPASPYGSTGWAPGNRSGKAAFILGLASLAVTSVLIVVQRAMIFADDRNHAAISVLTLIHVVTSLWMYGVTLVFGIAGLRRIGAPKALAGIGTGIAVAGLSQALLGLFLEFGTTIIQ